MNSRRHDRTRGRRRQELSNGAKRIRIEDPADLAAALATGMAERNRPTLIDVIVTRDPAKMLPGVDSRTLEVKPGDRPV